MSKYLTKHLTEAAYEAAASNLAKPHVALTADDNKVHYMANTPSPSHIEGEFYYRNMNVTGYHDGNFLVDWNGKLLWAAVDGTQNGACALEVEDVNNDIVIVYLAYVNERDSRFADSPVGTLYGDDIEYLDGATYENHTFLMDEEEYFLRCTPNIIGEW